MELRQEQEKTLNTARLKYGFFSKLLFSSMDLLYGRKRTLIKFKVIELLARIPYQAWERGTYRKITLNYGDAKGGLNEHEFIEETRAQQDNEQWHLYIIQELIYKLKIKENYILHTLIPVLAAFGYYLFSKILFFFSPKTSFLLNIYFEDHAEHEYMLLVKENPEFDDMFFDSRFKKVYGDYKTYGDVFRRIGIDEREHKQESQKYMSQLNS